LHFNTHCKVWGSFAAAVSCAKTAELIEMQFRMLSRVGPGNMYYMGMVMRDWVLFGGVWPIGKHCKV